MQCNPNDMDSRVRARVVRIGLHILFPRFSQTTESMWFTAKPGVGFVVHL
jgi:hypothetical protein